MPEPARVLVPTRISPALRDRIRSAAREAGISANAWQARAWLAALSDDTPAREVAEQNSGPSERQMEVESTRSEGAATAPRGTPRPTAPPSTARTASLPREPERVSPPHARLRRDSTGGDVLDGARGADGEPAEPRA